MNGRPKLREDDRTVHEADGREEQEDIEVRAERTWSTRPGLLSSAIQCIADWQQRVTASNKLYERSNQSHSSGKMPVHHSMCDAILATAINIKAGGAEGGGREERCMDGGQERGPRPISHPQRRPTHLRWANRDGERGGDTWTHHICLRFSIRSSVSSIIRGQLACAQTHKAHTVVPRASWDDSAPAIAVLR